jgi:hypothetical protein
MILKCNWPYLFANAHRNLLKRREINLRRPSEMPLEEDLAKTKIFVEGEIKELLEDKFFLFGTSEFNRLRAAVVSRVTLFNARRGGEPSKLTVKEWLDADSGVWLPEAIVEKISDPLEQYLAGKYKLAYQQGKGGKCLVPLLIPLDVIPAIKKLIECRPDVGVPEENPWLFPYTGGSLDHCRGWDAIQEVTAKASLAKPRLIIATKMRHRCSTSYALLDVTPAEKEAFLSHMGHTAEVNKNIYQNPPGYLEVCKVGRFLEALETGVTSGTAIRHLSDLDIGKLK